MIRHILPKDIQKLSQIEAFVSFDKASFQDLEFDSRDISDYQKTLFVCLKGQKSDGHDYIQELLDKGVKNFLISDKQYISEVANFYFCEDTVLGFQQIAKKIRKDFEKPVIAITGSNGKTIVKEWLGQLLSMRYSVCKSPKSFNSQIGVPYSVSKLGGQDFGVFETGVSEAGEMQKLQEVLSPTIGVFTNVGDAHAEGFQSIEEKLEEKLSLFESCQKIIYCENQSMVSKAIKAKFPSDRLIGWGADAKYKVTIKQGEKKSSIKINEELFVVNFIDAASLENVTHSIVTALVVGLSVQEIHYGLNLLSNLAMRMEIKEGANNNLILNDSYNNDLAGLKMTLDLAKKLDATREKILIVSDFVHQKTEDKELLSELVAILKQADLKHVFWVGELGSQLPETFNVLQFRSKLEVINHLKTQRFHELFFIVKGARQFEFESIIDVLERKQHITRIEVNLSQLIQNLGYYKSLLKPTTKMMVMVKAFAYGTGMVEVSKLLEMNQVDYLAVAYTDEGITLRENGVQAPIMVMNVTEDDYDNLVAFDLEPEIYSLEQFQYFVGKASKLRYHLKLDTGMHRLGFEEKCLGDLLDFIKENKQVEIVSVFTHLASSENALDDDFTELQISRFNKMALEIQDVCGYKLLFHALNSSGIERFANHQFDMVRLGIGLYGFGVKESAEAKQVIALKTNISQVKSLSSSETVGYNRRGKSSGDFKIATVPIGYADGFDRRFSNGVGAMLINGIEAKVIGNVCMDMTMVDVTNIACKAGDEVIVYGEKLTVETQAKKIGTISYELLTHLSERVRRIFYFD